jgi:hypothetical protein
MHTSATANPRINNALALALAPVAESLAEREAKALKARLFVARMKEGKERKARIVSLRGRVHGARCAITRLHN